MGSPHGRAPLQGSLGADLCKPSASLQLQTGDGFIKLLVVSFERILHFRSTILHSTNTDHSRQ